MKPKPSPRLPRLRFPEFLHEGEWEEKRLAAVGEYTGGGTPSKLNPGYWVGVNPWVSSSDVADDDIFGIKITRFISDEAVINSATKAVPPNSILVVSRVGVGKLAITKEKIHTSQDFINITPFNGNLIFLAYRLKSIEKILHSLNQGMAIKGFTKEDLLNLSVSLPSLAEQQKIADCLSSLDRLIAAEQRRLEALRTHKRGLLQQLFPAPGERLPRLRFPEFADADDWEEKKLGEVCEKVGSGITPQGGQSAYTSSGRPFIRSQNVGWSELLLEDVAYIDDETHLRFRSTEISSNDVLLNITGASIGRSAIADERIVGGNVNQHVCIIRVIRIKLNFYYLNQYLISEYGQEQINGFQAGGNRQGLNFQQIRSILIPIPPLLTEQQKIADSLSALGAQLEAQRRRLEALRTHKRGLMQQLFPPTTPA